MFFSEIEILNGIRDKTHQIEHCKSKSTVPVKRQLNAVMFRSLRFQDSLCRGIKDCLKWKHETKNVTAVWQHSTKGPAEITC